MRYWVLLGSLVIGGLSERDRERVEKLFRIRPGEPLRETARRAGWVGYRLRLDLPSKAAVRRQW